MLSAVWVAGAGLTWGTWSAGSADAHGYISQAALWLQGDLVIEKPMATTVPWPDPEWTFAPLGYRPGLQPGTLVPIYPVGLPLVMAAVQAVAGPQAVYVVVPLFGVIAVLAAAALAARLATPAAGAIAAVCLASSPTFLFSLMWPMSDVPAAASWVLALVLAAGSSVASACGAGLAIALAVLTRPNLVLVALAPGFYLLWRAWTSPQPRIDWTRLVIVSGIGAMGCLGVAAVHTWLYGSPLSTGYGHASQIYDVARLPETASGFVFRPLALEPLLVVLSIAGLATLLWRRGPSAPLTWLAAGAMGLVLVSYSFYVTFPEWWYLRLLLPAWPMASAFAGVGAAGLAGLLSGRLRVAALAAIAAAFIATGSREAIHRGVFDLRAAESRYEAVARFAVEALPDHAVFFSFQQSGALHHYAGRPIIRFDIIEPRSFEDAISRMRTRGFRPYFVIEDAEEVLFKARFRPVSPLGYLDWEPMGVLEGPAPVRVYDPADRDKMRRGEPYMTLQMRP